MGRKCCVPGCTSNYNTDSIYTPSFIFPKDKDRCALWIKSINRANFKPSGTAVVCVHHFDERFVIREDKLTRDDGTLLVYPRKNLALTKDAYPTIFPQQPSYLSKELPAKRKSPSKRRQEMEARDDEKFSQWFSADEIASFKQFTEKCASTLQPEWLHMVNDDFVIIYKISTKDCPKIIVSLKIFKDLSVKVWHMENLIDINTLSWILGAKKKCDRWTTFDSLLNFLATYQMNNITFHQKLSAAVDLLQKCYEEIDENTEHKLRLKFLQEQVSLLSLQQIRYSSDLLIWASKLYFCYPASYMLIRNSNVLVLPHPCYLKKLSTIISCTGSNSVNSHIGYLKQKASLLDQNEKIVNLLLDEIYVNPCLSYKAGHLAGISANSNTEATTIQAFMIVSLFSKNKDIVSLIPVKNLTAQTLHTYTLKVLNILAECGYLVLSLISDNNRINRNMFTIMCNGELKSSISHPQYPEKKLFFLFDTVHLIKSIRNNWLNNSNQIFYYPNPNDYVSVSTANLSHLKEIFEKEKNKFVKLAPKLSQKVLFPTSTERQNVTHALNLFHETNSVALGMSNEITESRNHGTKEFIDYIWSWWKIVNVKHPQKGIHTRDKYCEPIYNNVLNENVLFLQKFVSWLAAWDNIRNLKTDEKVALGIAKKGGTLSKETHFALNFTVQSFLSMIEYVFSTCSPNYILLGKFQTDSLEGRFGQYRQMSGGNYSISYTQVIESEKKLKVLSLIALYSEKMGEFKIKHLELLDSDTIVEEYEIPEKFYEIFNTYNDFEITVSTLSIILFLAGYVAYKVGQKLNCELCISVLSEDRKLSYEIPEEEEVYKYLQLMDRGGLKWPQKFIVDIVSQAYQIFQKLITKDYEEEFLRIGKQKQLIIQLTLEKLELLNLIPSIKCSCGIDRSTLAKNSLSTITNIFLNNYTKIKNDKRTMKNFKRKLSTFTKS